MRITLHVSSEGGVAVPLDFEKKNITVGRSPDADVVLSEADISVSRRHAELQWHGDRWQLRDLHSTHGTFLNGQRITQATVSDGDTLKLGEVGPSIRITYGDTISANSATSGSGYLMMFFVAILAGGLVVYLATRPAAPIGDSPQPDPTSGNGSAPIPPPSTSGTPHPTGDSRQPRADSESGSTPRETPISQEPVPKLPIPSLDWGSASELLPQKVGDFQLGKNKRETTETIDRATAIYKAPDGDAVVTITLVSDALPSLGLVGVTKKMFDTLSEKVAAKEDGYSTWTSTAPIDLRNDQGKVVGAMATLREDRAGVAIEHVIWYNDRLFAMTDSRTKGQAEALARNFPY